MYQILANDEVLLYDSTIDDYKIAAGSGVLETNKAGSFTFTIFPDHFYYYKFVKKRTVITVVKSDTVIFRGRLLDDKVDYWKRKTLICEGELNTLCDSVLAPFSYTGTAAGFVQKVVNLHRINVSNPSNPKYITINSTTASKLPSETTTFVVPEYISAMDCLKQYLLDPYDLRLFLRYLPGYTTGVCQICCFASTSGTIASQPIEFGTNLRDFVKIGTGQNICTAVVPLSIQEDDSILDISSVNSGNNYVQDNAAVALRGKILKCVYFDGITDPTTLMNLGKDYLAEAVKEEVTITLTALDMHMLDRSIESYGVNQYVRCVSPPHDFAETLLCYKQTFDLLRPQNDTIVLGGTCRSLTGSITKLAASGGNVDLSGVNSKISGLQSSMSAAKADISTNAGNIQKLNVKTEEYETAQQQMNDLLAKSFGVFHTAEAQTDGSTIHYLHDKPTLSGSTTIWKMTGDAFMVSTDGGKTYSAGMDSSGNALVNILSAIGIEATWINCDNLMALSANLGGWLIDGTKIYKEIRHPSNSSIRYRVYFKPPVQSSGAVATEILTCEISRNSGSTWTDLLTIDADGSALFHSEDKGTYKIHGSFMELIDADGVQIARIGTQSRTSTEVMEEVVEEEVVEEEVVEEEVVEEEVVEEVVEEVIEEEVVEEEVVEEVVYEDIYTPEAVLMDDSTSKYQVVLNPSFIQFGDKSRANRAYLRRDDAGRYVLRVDRLEIKDKNSSKTAYIRFEDGKYVLKVDEIAAKSIDVSNNIATEGISAHIVKVSGYVDSDGGYKEGGVWYEDKWGIA